MLGRAVECVKSQGQELSNVLRCFDAQSLNWLLGCYPCSVRWHKGDEAERQKGRKAERQKGGDLLL